MRRVITTPVNRGGASITSNATTTKINCRREITSSSPMDEKIRACKDEGRALKEATTGQVVWTPASFKYTASNLETPFTMGSSHMALGCSARLRAVMRRTAEY